MREQRPSARILIADDHQLLADAWKSLLEPEFQVVGIVLDGRHLIELGQRPAAHVHAGNPSIG